MQNKYYVDTDKIRPGHRVEIFTTEAGKQMGDVIEFDDLRETFWVELDNSYRLGLEEDWSPTLGRVGYKVDREDILNHLKQEVWNTEANLSDLEDHVAYLDEVVLRHLRNQKG